jgi:cytochrome P450
MQRQEESNLAKTLTIANAIATLFTCFAVSTVLSFLRTPKYPTSVPWVGYGKGWIASLKNAFAGFTNSTQWISEGYEKYSKHGKTFVLPGILGAPAETVLPRSQMRWMLDQPDNVLSTQAAHNDILHGRYAFVKPIIVQDPYHERVLHKNLARNMNAVLPELNDEVCRDVEELCGTDVEHFKRFGILDGFMMKLVPKITNRVLVGEPLCRNPDFLANMLAFTLDVVRVMLVLAFVPKMLHPIVGNLVGLAGKYHYWRTRKCSLPLINRRLEDTRRKDAGDPNYKEWKEPNDYITWCIRTAQAEGRQDELDPSMIAMRIMPLNFASIHTTAMTGHAALVDILSSDPSVIAGLREEAERIYREEGGRWTKQGLARMYRIDSAIRESQRHSPIALTFLTKKVMVKEGIASPEGIHFAYGTILSCPWSPVAQDGELHERAEEYDAFRYSREREAYERMSLEGKQKVDELKLRQNGLVTTSDKHLAFGHGRHAWYVTFFLSLIAYSRSLVLVVFSCLMN